METSNYHITLNQTLIIMVLVLMSFFCAEAFSQDLAVNSEKSGFSATAELNSITELNLSNSAINLIPENVFEMTSLEILDLHGNPIENLPRDIRNLQNLRVLNLTGTNIDALPRELKMLIHLQEIHLDFATWEFRLDKIQSLTRARIMLE